jgi:biopolymer transport protein ExbD
MDHKRALGLALCAAALILIGWGLFAARAPKPAAQATYVQPPPWVEVYLFHDGGLRVGDKPSSLQTLPADIAAVAGSPDRAIQGVRLTEEVTVESRVHKAVMARIRDSGWSRIDLEVLRQGQLPGEAPKPQSYDLR